MPFLEKGKGYRYTYTFICTQKTAEIFWTGFGLLNHRQNKPDTTFSPLVPFILWRNKTFLKQQYTFRKTWGILYCKTRQSDLRFSRSVNQQLSSFVRKIPAWMHLKLFVMPGKVSTSQRSSGCIWNAGRLPWDTEFCGNPMMAIW